MKHPHNPHSQSAARRRELDAQRREREQRKTQKALKKIGGKKR